MAELNEKQKRFVREYLVDLNATQAAVRAGYSIKTAKEIGYENLTKPHIAAAVDEALATEAGITRTRVIDELARIGFANMDDYIRITNDGEPFIDLSEMTREQAAAINEVTVEDFKDGRGKDARQVRRVKFKMNDKLAALDKIGRALRMFKDQVVHTGDEENPIHHQHDGLHEFRGRIAGIASRTGEGRANGHANGRSGNGSAS